ncbi:hypothetical protein QMI71_002953 [Salmonella enterica]|nr:hypothetical protein [Salmonella enterica]
MTENGGDMNVTTYISLLTKRLELFNTIQRMKFGIWCLWPMINDFEIISFLDKMNGDGTGCYLKKELESIWNGKFDSDKLRSLSTCIKNIDWDQDEIDEVDESAAQGTMDLLGGISSLTYGYLDNSVEYIANCAELIINRVSYLIDFEKLNEDALNIEFKNQEAILNIIYKNEDSLLSLKSR